MAKQKAQTTSEPAQAEPAQAPPSPIEQFVNPSEGLTIDERMANLLAEHQAMGARPKDEEPAP